MTEAVKQTKGAQAKAHIVACAARLFVKNGYYATGIRDVLIASGVSKGSFYFYFESKKELGVAVFEYYQSRLLTIFRKMAEGRTWPEFTDELVAWITGNARQEKNYGCPFAVLGMETAFIEPELAKLSYCALLDTVAVFQIPMLNSGLGEEEAAQKAEWVFSTYEGYMMRYRISKDIEELEKLGKAMKGLI